MTSNLQLVKSTQFNGVAFDCYKDAEQLDNSDFWSTREQIGQLLEYEFPDESIRKIHQRNQERLDKFSTRVKMTRVEGDRTVTRDVIVYDFKGLLEICRYSNQPKADAVMDFLWNIADEIRRTGSYGIPKQTNPEDLKARREELAAKNRELDIRKAELLKSLIGMCPMTDETKAVFTHEAFKALTGTDYLPMLPKLKEAMYSATDIAKEVGLSPNMVGRIANANNLKPKQGESNEYGTWIRSKSKHSNHECATFVYNDKALTWFKQHREFLN